MTSGTAKEVQDWAQVRPRKGRRYLSAEVAGAAGLAGAVTTG